MSRLSVNEEVNGIVKNGFDYTLQVWVENYVILDCGHLKHTIFNSPCCNAHTLAGKDIRTLKTY